MNASAEKLNKSFSLGFIIYLDFGKVRQFIYIYAILDR